MRLPNDVRAAKCSERWIGLRSPVSCAKPTTSEDDTVFSSVSVMPTDKSSKKSVRSGGRFMRQIHTDSLLAGALLLGRGHRAWPRRTARIVPIGHALFEEGIARCALQFLVIGAELARRPFLFRVDGETRTSRHQHDQGSGTKRISRHGYPPGTLNRHDSTGMPNAQHRRQFGAIKRHDLA